MRLNRRGFLRLAGAGACSSLLAGSALGQGTARARSSTAEELAILYDVSKCIGCRACQTACRKWNQLPAESTDPQGIYDSPMGLSANTWTLITLSQRDANNWHFFNHQCMHCTDAACVTVCPSGALFKDEHGFTAYDVKKCIGCGYCTQFCPYEVPHLNTASIVTGRAKMGKCRFCQDRIWLGIGGPFCAESCPVGALVWGSRDELLAGARERVSLLQQQGISNARLYGENEVGGLHRLSIILGEPEDYNLPRNPTAPPTVARIWQKIIQPVGSVAFGATILGIIGAFFIIRRNIRMEEVQ